jgi:hypothetical protein
MRSNIDKTMRATPSPLPGSNALPPTVEPTGPSAPPQRAAHFLANRLIGICRVGSDLRKRMWDSLQATHYLVPFL